MENETDVTNINETNYAQKENSNSTIRPVENKMVRKIIQRIKKMELKIKESGIGISQCCNDTPEWIRRINAIIDPSDNSTIILRKDDYYEITLPDNVLSGVIGGLLILSIILKMCSRYLGRNENEHASIQVIHQMQQLPDNRDVSPNRVIAV